MSSSDDSSQAPWADPQTHLDADPVTTAVRWRRTSTSSSRSSTRSASDELASTTRCP